MEWNILDDEMIREEVWKDSTFQKGRTLLRNKHVELKEITELKDDHLKVSANVNGTERYKVNLEISDWVDYDCTCPAYKSFSGACKHVVAVMLAYNERAAEHNENQLLSYLTSAEKPKEYHAAMYMMNQMADFLDADTGFRGRKKLKVEYHFAFESWDRDDASSIRVKVGTEKLYQMKDIVSNGQALLYEQPVEFGKHFVYDPADHYISTKDRDMLRFLVEINNYRFQSNSYYSYRSGNRTEVEIPPVLIKDVIKKLIHNEYYRIKLNHRDHDSRHIADPLIFEEGESLLPVPFEIAPVEGQPEQYYFSLDHTEGEQDQFLLYENAKILVKENELYFLTDEEIRILSILFMAINERQGNQVLVPKSMMKDFLINALPSIKKRFPVKIDNQVKKEYHKEPLVSKMYVDYIDHRLWMDVEFHYGGQFYHPFLSHGDSDELPETMLLDLEKEGEILNFIYDFEFPFIMEEKGLVLEDEEEIYRFLFDALPELGQRMEVYTTSNLNQMIYNPPQHPRLVVDMDQKSNLLHITFDIEGIEEKDLKKIMQDLASQKKFRRLSNGKLINLQDQAFQEYHRTLTKMEVPIKEMKREMELPLHRLFALDEEMLKRAELENPVRNFLNRLGQVEPKEYPLPKALEANLRPYQVEGYQWLKMMDEFNFGGILADDMGLGKTVQALAFIASVLEEQTKPILVICPSSVLYNWQKESKQFIPSVKTILITGTKEERQASIQEAKDQSIPVWITSYPVLIRDSEWYEDVEFRTIILDEAQIVKNNVAKTTKAARLLKAENKFALSGTPLENQLGELYSIFSIAVPGLFTSQKGFKKMDVQQINRKIRPFVLRRLKKDVLKDLPEKVESIEYIDLSPEQKAMYVSQLRLVRNETNALIQEGNLESNRIKVLAGLTRLRQICCDPRLVNPSFKGESTKLERLMEYLETAQENGKRVVLFSQFTQMLGLIQDRLKKEGRDYFYLDGNTPNQDRLALTTRFNEGEKDLFLISLRAGGTGLNLTGGDTVILYDSWWNPAVESQATDRVHRFGQKNMVQVIRMICTGTIEERINELQGRKRELIDQVISDGQQSLTSLSKEEILAILSD